MPSVKTILFEPDPREYAALKTKSKKETIVLNSALSDSIREVDFHLCKKQQVSSVYLPNFSFLNKFYDPKRFEVVETIKIKADTLDSQLMKNNIKEIDFVKVDAQGYELSILQGGIRSIKTAIGLEVEVEFSPLYENQPLFSEVDNFLRERGFQLFDIKRHFWIRGEGNKYENKKGQLIFGDALYFRGPEDIMSMSGIMQEKIIRAICVYFIYGYPDLARALSDIADDQGALSKENLRAINTMLLMYQNENWCPNFRGKGRIQDFFLKMAGFFSIKNQYYEADRSLGNL